jgi:hypothetical protein
MNFISRERLEGVWQVEPEYIVVDIPVDAKKLPLKKRERLRYDWGATGQST